ncbi:MAG: biopolymer transporter ExbD [Betaproteobacteria bacterium]|nr:biopolymer transporter ExbD [Betaproteobacteria bacterium]
MNFRRSTPRDEPEINFIPLIDLLLVILIFLMVTTTYTRFTELGVNLPSAGADKPAERPRELMVTVSADGRYAIEDKVRPYDSPGGFAQALQRAAGGRADITLVINADAGASHQSVVNVLEAARLAGLNRVTFAAQASGTGQR